MKCCSKCGGPITEKTKFCANCGTKIKLENIPDNTSQTAISGENKKKTRVALMVLAITFFFFASFMLLGVLTDGIEHIFSMLFFAILGVMFFCLSKTPKKSKYLFGKSNGLTKTLFVMISIIISIVIVMISPETPTQDNPSHDISVEKNNEDVSNKKSETVPIEETVISVDKLELLVAVTVENEEYYTPNTYAVYVNALEEANYIIVNGADTQSDVDVAAEYLESSIANLQKRADKTELDTKIEEAKSIDVSPYLPVTASALQEAIKNAEIITEDINAIETDVKQAILSINNAISGLELLPDKTRLETLLKKANNCSETKYTTASYSQLLVAIEKAQMIYDNGDTKQDEVDTASSVLSEAIDALVKSTKCVWRITVNLDMIDNNNIGDDWDWSIIYKGEEVNGTFEITAKEGKEITIKGKAVEEDNSPDRGSGSITLKLKDGNGKSKTFSVKENRGRYAGRKAKWELEVSCELLERI